MRVRPQVSTDSLWIIPRPAVIQIMSPAWRSPSSRSQSVPSSTSVTVSSPAWGWAPPICLRCGMSRRSSISNTKGSLAASAVGASTSTAVWPAPMNPGTGGGVVRVDERVRLGEPVALPVAPQLSTGLRLSIG